MFFLHLHVFLFSSSLLLRSLPPFFLGRENVGHPGTAPSPEWRLRQCGHGGGRAALPPYPRPGDPEAVGRHQGARVSLHYEHVEWVPDGHTWIEGIPRAQLLSTTALQINTSPG